MKDLSRFFYPESIAVIGASENILKWGSVIFSNILDGGFSGDVYPVSVNNDTVYSRKAFKKLGDIGKPVDLVIVTTPATTVMDILRECVESGTRNVLVVSSGFSEAGEEGKKLEREMSDFSRRHDINIAGPNTMGMANFNINLHGMFPHVRLNRGGISLMAQSGNVGNQIMYWAEQQSIGLGKFIGSGNEAVLKCEDYLNYFHDDEDTSVILMYIEGIDNGRSFMEAAKKTTLRKPLVALKGGRTRNGNQGRHVAHGSAGREYQYFQRRHGAIGSVHGCFADGNAHPGGGVSRPCPCRRGTGLAW